MPTSNTQVISDSGSVVVNSSTRWPAYTTKFDLLSDLFDAIGSSGGAGTAIFDVIMKLSNTDTSSALADKASRARDA